jgi:hypothetical protein
MLQICCCCVLQPLPDISGWEYGGTASLHNAQVHIWQRFNKQMGKVSTYTFYTTEDGTPVRFERLQQ